MSFLSKKNCCRYDAPLLLNTCEYFLQNKNFPAKNTTNILINKFTFIKDYNLTPLLSMSFSCFKYLIFLL